jgi:hypothetical protein
MEPRPPRPRSARPFETSGPPESDGIGERLYPPPGEPASYAPGEPYPPGTAPEPPLLPRRQRRQRGVLRGILGTMLAIAAVALIGWYFWDDVQGVIAPPAPQPTPAVAAVDDAATPTAAPESAALPNALATVTPTPPPALTPTPEPAETAPAVEIAPEDPSTRDRDISAQTLPLLDFLPTQDQLPPGLILADEAERSKAEVVSQLGGTDEASQLLDDWGWAGNAYRDYIASEEAPPPSGTTFLNVSVHRFASPEAAATALIFFSDQVIFGQGLQEVEPPAIGDSARLLVGPSGEANLAVLYAQQGPILYRIGGSAGGDPAGDVLTVAAAIVSGQATGG